MKTRIKIMPKMKMGIKIMPKMKMGIKIMPKMKILRDMQGMERTQKIRSTLATLTRRPLSS